MHQDKIEEVINAAVKKKMGKGTNILDAGIKYFSKALIKGALDIAFDKMLTVNDYYIFSIGKIEYDGEEHIISVGVMNNIITFDEEDVVREIENHVW